MASPFILYRCRSYPNVKGRISYMHKPLKQENLYATYPAPTMNFGVTCKGKAASRGLMEAAQRQMYPEAKS